MSASRKPDMKVARISPSMPCWATVAATSTMKAPAGPADLEARAAQQRDEEAADDRRVEPLRGRGARGDGDGHGEGQRDDGDGEAGHRIHAQMVRGHSPRAAR